MPTRIPLFYQTKAFDLLVLPWSPSSLKNKFFPSRLKKAPPLMEVYYPCTYHTHTSTFQHANPHLLQYSHEALVCPISSASLCKMLPSVLCIPNPTQPNQPVKRITLYGGPSALEVYKQTSTTRSMRAFKQKIIIINWVTIGLSESTA